MTAFARPLPVLLPPVHHELLGCYLHRLADANHLTIRDLSHQIGPSRYHPRDSDDITGWTSRAVTRLAALTGTTTIALLHALPVLQTAALTGQPTAPGRLCRPGTPTPACSAQPAAGSTAWLSSASSRTSGSAAGMADGTAGAPSARSASGCPRFCTPTPATDGSSDAKALQQLPSISSRHKH